MKASSENELRQKTAALTKKQEELNRVMHDVSTVSQSVCCIGWLPELNPQAHTLQQSLSKVETEAAVERQTIKSAYKEKKHRLHDVEQLLTQARAELALAHARIEKVGFLYFVWFICPLFDSLLLCLVLFVFLLLCFYSFCLLLFCFDWFICVLFCLFEYFCPWAFFRCLVYCCVV
jgi:hypothetical protein